MEVPRPRKCLLCISWSENKKILLLYKTIQRSIAAAEVDLFLNFHGVIHYFFQLLVFIIILWRLFEWLFWSRRCLRHHHLLANVRSSGYASSKRNHVRVCQPTLIQICCRFDETATVSCAFRCFHCCVSKWFRFLRGIFWQEFQWLKVFETSTSYRLGSHR